MKINKITRNDNIAAIAIALFIFFFIFLSSPLIGLVRDEGFYMKAAINTASWFESMERDFSKGNLLKPFQKNSIDRYFKFNREHPTFMKNFFGFSYYLFNKKLAVLTFVQSIRIVAALFSALTALMICYFSLLFFNRLTAIAAPFLFFLMPHIFFHSHLACFDIPILFFWTGMFFLYALYLFKPTKKLAIYIAIFYGFAMATKHNVFFIPILFVLIWLVFHLLRYKNLDDKYRGFSGFFKSVPFLFYIMPLISIPVYLLSWPWLWYNTVDRFIWYLNFHAKHVNYSNYYFGMELARAPFPFSYPWGMTFFTTPLPQLILFVGSVVFIFKKVLCKKETLQTKEFYIVLLTGALFPIFLIALPSVPIFGGIKHFFTGFPILIVTGFYFTMKGGGYFLSKYNKTVQNRLISAIILILFIALIPMNIKFSQHGAAFFNLLIGGSQGAANSYMQRNFWGYDILPLVRSLNKTAPRGAKVYIMGYYEGLNWNSFQYLKKEGIIRRDLQGTNDLEDADFAFFFYEKQNEKILYNIYEEFGTARPLALSEADSVLFSALFRRVK